MRTRRLFTAASSLWTSSRLSTTGSTSPRFGVIRSNTLHFRPSVTSKKNFTPHRCCRTVERDSFRSLTRYRKYRRSSFSAIRSGGRS